MKQIYIPRYREESFAYIVSLPDGNIDLYDKKCRTLLREGRFDELEPYRMGISSHAFSSGELTSKGIMDSVLKSRNPLKSPIIVQLELTSSCNLKCDHCFNHSGARRDNELTTEEVKKLLRDLKKREVMSVFFTGGEPTLRKDFVEILNYAHSLDLDCQVNTNGTTLTEKLLSQVPKCVFFMMSMDGIHSNRKLHGGSYSFDGLKRLVRLLRRSNFQFYFQGVVQRDNIGEMEATFKWCRRNKVNFTCMDLCYTGRAMKHPRLFVEPGQMPLLESLTRYIIEYEKSQMTWEMKEHQGYPNPNHFTLIARLEKLFGRSLPSVFVACITSDGDVYPDAWHAGQDLFRGGNIRKHSFGDIWDNSFARIRALVEWKRWTRCKTCGLNRTYCGFRLPVLSYNLYGRYTVCGASELQKRMSMLRQEIREKCGDMSDVDVW